MDATNITFKAWKCYFLLSFVFMSYKVDSFLTWIIIFMLIFVLYLCAKRIGV